MDIRRKARALQKVAHLQDDLLILSEMIRRDKDLNAAYEESIFSISMTFKELNDLKSKIRKR